jgi:hypothetical protein
MRFKTWNVRVVLNSSKEISEEYNSFSGGIDQMRQGIQPQDINATYYCRENATTYRETRFSTQINQISK